MEKMLDQEHRLTAVEDRSKSNTKRIDELKKRTDDIEELVTSVAVIAEKQKQMGSDITDIKTNLERLAEKPSKRWDSIVDKVLSLVVAAVVAYMLTHLGL